MGLLAAWPTKYLERLFLLSPLEHRTSPEPACEFCSSYRFDTSVSPFATARSMFPRALRAYAFFEFAPD
jgi:hypothetical protein